MVKREIRRGIVGGEFGPVPRAYVRTTGRSLQLRGVHIGGVQPFLRRTSFYLGFDFPSYQLNGNILHVHTVSPTAYESEFLLLYLTNHSSCPLDSPPALTLGPIPGGMVRDNLTLAACQCLCRCHRTETKNKECRPTCFPRPIQCCMAY